MASFDGLRFRHWQLESPADGVLVLAFDRAEAAVNTFSQDVMLELGAILERIAMEPPKGVLVRSAKAAFAAGADLKSLQELDRRGQVASVGQQRRAALAPDLLVGLGAGARPPRQEDQVEQQPAADRVHVQHPRVGQELAQVPAHRLRRGLVGRAQVEQQQAGHGPPSIRARCRQLQFPEAGRPGHCPGHPGAEALEIAAECSWRESCSSSGAWR